MQTEYKKELFLTSGSAKIIKKVLQDLRNFREVSAISKLSFESNEVNVTLDTWERNIHQE